MLIHALCSCSLCLNVLKLIIHILRATLMQGSGYGSCNSPSLRPLLSPLRPRKGFSAVQFTKAIIKDAYIAGAVAAALHLHMPHSTPQVIACDQKGEQETC